MYLDYETGREVSAIFEPDFEQIVVLRGLVALCDALNSKKLRINGNYFKRRTIPEQTRNLTRAVRQHLSRASHMQMVLMGEFELEAIQRGMEEVLDNETSFDVLARPAAPGGDELSVRLSTIAKAEEYRMHAETIHLGLSTRELPRGWRPVFQKR